MAQRWYDVGLRPRVLVNWQVIRRCRALVGTKDSLMVGNSGTDFDAYGGRAPDRMATSGRRPAMPAGMRIVVVAFLTAITACGGNGPTGGDLAIQGTASAFQVAIPEVVPDTWYQLKVMIINFSTDTTGGDIGDFEVSCEIFASDALGVWRKSLMTQSVGNLTVDAFDTTEAVFAPFRQVPGAELSAYFYIDCRADPDAAVAEIDEENNGFTFLFQAYCMGGSNPCPGPIQTGPSLPYIPPNTPAP